MRIRSPHHWAVLAAVLATSGSTFAADFVAPPLPPAVTFPSAKVVKVTDTGAVADDTTLCTAAIAKAIDQCMAAAGGGVVEIPQSRQSLSHWSHRIPRATSPCKSMKVPPSSSPWIPSFIPSSKPATKRSGCHELLPPHLRR